MKRLPALFVAPLFLVSTSLWAAPPFPPPGNIARAVAELQAEVAALRGDLAAETAARQAAEAALQAQLNTVAAGLAGVQGNSVLALGGILTLETIDGYPTARFTGVNVQIVNGLDSTASINGLGNLIVGYNEPHVIFKLCSNGLWKNQTDCEAHGETWAANHKTGSHNIVGGDGNAYSQYGGLIVGRQNAINGPVASVSGGNEGLASGVSSSVSGGFQNVASGNWASVSAGTHNEASNDRSSVTGGSFNVASGFEATVIGGKQNTASGAESLVTGGNNCIEAGSFGWSVGTRAFVLGCFTSN